MGKCKCGRPLVSDTMCQDCLDYQKDAYHRRKAERQSSNTCLKCKAPIEPEASSTYYCLACKKDKREYSKKANRDIKLETLRVYGSRCHCCGEDRPDFLAIDHIEGGGTKQREEIGAGTKFYLWLEKHGYPRGFQVLCHNCNFSKHLNGGMCSHEKDPEWEAPPEGDILGDIRQFIGYDYAS